MADPVASRDPDFEQRVRRSFGEQRVMGLIGASIAAVRHGYCEIHLPYRPDLTQQDGFVHAGIVSTIIDTAGGYAGYSVMPADSRVLTVDYRLSLLRPAAGELIVACAQVVKPGRTLVFTEGEVFADRDGERKLCATMSQTLICIRDNDPAGA